MRIPKDFFRPLAVGAPAAAPRDPVPAVADDPLLPAVATRRWWRRCPTSPPKVDVLLGQPRGRRPGRRQGGGPRRPGRGRQERRLRRHPALDPGQLARLAVGRSTTSPPLVTEVGDKLDVIMIPKVEGPEDIHYVDRLLAQLEAKAGLTEPLLVHAILETARGVANVEEICAASAPHAGPVARPGRPRRQPAHEDHPRRRRPPRLPGAPGPRSTTTSTRPRATYQQDLWHYTIARMVDACVANGILPFYGPVRRHQGRRGLRGPVPQRLPARLRRRLEPAPGADRHRQAGVLAPTRPTWPTPSEVIEAMGDGTGAVHARREDGGRRLGEAVPGDRRPGPAARRPRPRAGRALRLLTGAEADGMTDRRSPPPPLGPLHARRQRAGPREGQGPRRRRPDPRPRGRRGPRRQGRGPRPGRAPPPRPATTAARRSPSGSTASTPRGTPTTSRAAAEAGPAAVVVPKVNSVADVARHREGASRPAAPPTTPGSGPWSRRRSPCSHAEEIAARQRAPRRAGDGHQRPRQGAARRARPRPPAAAHRPRPVPARRPRRRQGHPRRRLQRHQGRRRASRPSASRAASWASTARPSSTRARSSRPTACAPRAPTSVDDARGAHRRLRGGHAEGKGVVTYNGRMIENLHVDNARRTLAVADAIAARG